jgi:hypothetical protein
MVDTTAKQATVIPLGIVFQPSGINQIMLWVLSFLTIIFRIKFPAFHPTRYPMKGVLC